MLPKGGTSRWPHTISQGHPLFRQLSLTGLADPEPCCALQPWNRAGEAAPESSFDGNSRMC